MRMDYLDTLAPFQKRQNEELPRELTGKGVPLAPWTVFAHYYDLAVKWLVVSGYRRVCEVSS